MKWLYKILMLSYEPPFDDEAWFGNANNFKNEFRPKDGAVAAGVEATPEVMKERYKWLREYGREKQKDLIAFYDKIDEKADAIIKYLGGGTAILAVLSIASLNATNAWIAPFYVPTVVFTVIAIYMATRARMPRDFLHLPPVDRAVRLIELGGENQIIGQMHVACQGLAEATSQKSWYVTWSARAFYWALLSLLLPVVVWAGAKMRETSPPPAPKVEIETPVGKITITK